MQYSYTVIYMDKRMNDALFMLIGKMQCPRSIKLNELQIQNEHPHLGIQRK